MLRAALRGGLDGGGRLVPRAERIYTVIEALTADARDHSLDYKISGLRVTKGSWEAQVVDALEPLPDEIVLPKGSSSVFVSTNITYVLRNLGVEQYGAIRGDGHGPRRCGPGGVELALFRVRVNILHEYTKKVVSGSG